jgi:pimeloyl-ACP methyl ester carboxylesterase
MMSNDSDDNLEIPATSRRDLMMGGVGALALASFTTESGSAFAKGPSRNFALPPAHETVAPFKVRVSQALLNDLSTRLALTRWPDKETSSGWAQGVPLSKAQWLIEHWSKHHDWRSFEELIDGIPQFRTSLDGLGIHFLHIRSKHEGALPLLLTHGWPGSFIEFLDVIAPLTDPTAHGGKAEDAFHVVIPSLPGYGFSDKPEATGWGLPRIAGAWHLLMERLGYHRYVAQGGDWGAGVVTWMAKQQPAGLLGIHLNLPILFPPPGAEDGGYSAAEKGALAQLVKFSTDGSAYAAMQSTRPQTLGYGLADSPAAQAMWIFEKFQSWTDNSGDVTEVIPVTRLLDNISLYWLTNTGTSSARLYYESFREDFVRTEISLPVAVSIFKGDSFTPPRSWGERTYSNLIYWNEVVKGGHFAAFEQPALFTVELRRSFRLLR